jgi:hypothetical protein
MKYYTVGTFLKSNRKIVGRVKIDTLTHIYMTTHFPRFVQTLQIKCEQHFIYVQDENTFTKNIRLH